jgi:hypothetical protein
MIVPVTDRLSRMKMIGWAGEHGYWVDPAAKFGESCPICEAEENDESP